MDLVTQGLLGAVLAQSAAPPEEIRRASLVGFGAGMLADADVLIRSASDPLLVLEYHRHFTHALLFIPLGALAAAMIFFPFLRKRMGFARMYLYAFLGYLCSGALDACTSYGTHLFWPFTAEPVALNLIAVVDPLFTVILMTACAAAFLGRGHRGPRIALVLCLLYLGLAAIQQSRAGDHLRSIAAQRGHQVERMVVKPTLGNILLWRSVYIASNKIHVDAIRAGAGMQHYPGGALPLFHAKRDAPQISPASVLGRDIERFRRFSAGYIAVHPEVPGILGDIRYSMLPVSTRPLWGITLDANRAGEHARYKTFRKQSPADRRRFLDMLVGR